MACIHTNVYVFYNERVAKKNEVIQRIREIKLP